jgi:hypothetical protein
MTKKTFESGDLVGRYTIDEFGGTNTSGQPWWWVTENGESKHLTEQKLRVELARAEWTPEKIWSLSSRAYDELRQEIGDDGIDEILSASRPKKEAPTSVQQREIAEKWFAWHPQIPRTRGNSKQFDEYLAKMPNPTFSSKDFDLAFADCFLNLELNPKVCGITGHGEAIQGWEAVETLTSSQVQQLHKTFPTPINAGDLTPKQALHIVADSMTAKEYDEFTKEVDKKQGIKQPIAPLLLHAREQTWSQFFQLHPSVIVTTELKDKLLEYLTKNGLSFALQHLGLALQSLIEEKDKSVVEQDSGVHSYGGTNFVTGEPRPKSPVIPFDDVPVTVTTAEINAMDSKTYDEKLKNPNFKKAVDNLLARATGRA